MAKQLHEGEELWRLLEEYDVNKSELAVRHLKKTNGLLTKWRKKARIDVQSLQMIRGYFLFNFGYDIRKNFPHLSEILPDSAAVIDEDVNIYGDPAKVISLKNREIEVLESKNIELTQKLNELYDKVFNGYFEKLAGKFETQNNLMKILIDTRVK